MKEILIVEDDVLIADQLQMIVENLGYSVPCICSSLKQTESFLLGNESPDLVFLDIRMNGVDEGINVAALLNKKNIPFVFITSFTDKQTLLDTIVLKPAGFIVKPYTKADIVKVLEKINETNEKSGYYFHQSGQNYTKIKYTEIYWIKSDNVYIEVVTKSGKHVLRMKLEEFLTQLDHGCFIRIHRSFAVNLDYIQKITKTSLFINDFELPISKKYKEELESVIK